MKHFHLNDPKSKLAHEIYNETQYLLELESNWNKHKKITENDKASYGTVKIALVEMAEIKRAITKQKSKISDLQKRHDNIKTKPLTP